MTFAVFARRRREAKFQYLAPQNATETSRRAFKTAKITSKTAKIIPKTGKHFQNRKNHFQNSKIALKTVEIAPVTAKSSRKSLPKTAQFSDRIVTGTVRTPVDEIRKLKPQTNRIPQMISVQESRSNCNSEPQPIEYRKWQAFRIEF